MMQHTFTGVAFRDWVNLLISNGGVAPSALSKAGRITLESIRNEGARKEEKARFHQEIENTQIEQGPVFVLGHWRSGTTFLQNILCNDPRFGYLNVVQSLQPHTFLSKENLYAQKFQQTKRFMDNVKLAANSPSEEEVAMAMLAPGSFWHGYYFPKHFDHYFYQYTLFRDIPAEALQAWKKAYISLIKKLTYRYEGKPLFLKNPPNTGRLTQLYEWFPNARFIHIYRNPYDVFYSRMKQYQSAVVFKALQHISEKEWEAKVLTYYKELMQQHFIQRESIPKERYIEVQFEELKKAPMETVQSIYEHLGLPDFQETRPHFKAYLDTLKNYEQNEYKMEKSVIEKVHEHWNFAIDKWSYSSPTFI